MMAAKTYHKLIKRKMYYKYLNREQHYLRSFRTHNLWFDVYMVKARTPRVTSFHVATLKRMAKSYSGVSNLNE